MAKKKRDKRRRGLAHPCAKFSADQIRSIRKDRRTMREIAGHYRVSCSVICDIKNRASYREVA